MAIRSKRRGGRTRAAAPNRRNHPNEEIPVPCARSDAAPFDPRLPERGRGRRALPGGVRRPSGVRCPGRVRGCAVQPCAHGERGEQRAHRLLLLGGKRRPGGRRGRRDLAQRPGPRKRAAARGLGAGGDRRRPLLHPGDGPLSQRLGRVPGARQPGARRRRPSGARSARGEPGPIRRGLPRLSQLVVRRAHGAAHLPGGERPLRQAGLPLLLARDRGLGAQRGDPDRGRAGGPVLGQRVRLL